MPTENLPPGNTEGQPVISHSPDPVPTEYEPKIRAGTQVVGVTEAEKAEAEAPAAADSAETHPLDELGLDTRTTNALGSQFKDVAAVEKYARENDGDFTGIEGIGEAGNEAIQKALKKRSK